MKMVFKTSEEGSYLKPLVEAFLLEEIPGAETTDKDLVVDAITKCLVGTRQTRLAGGPNPESLVLIRNVIRSSMERMAPIPILVPSGPKKPGGGPLDVAELSMMRILSCLNHNIARFHKPGINVRFRLEDETGLFLEGPNIVANMANYCRAFERLAQIIGHGVFEPVRESRISAGRLILEARELQPLFEQALKDRSFLPHLWEKGWKGPLSEALIQSLDERFRKVCPDLNNDGRLIHISKYLANTLARAKLGLSGTDEKWAPLGPVEISFAPPTPDSPPVSRRIYYRTVLLKHSKRHLPFWRAKGFLRVEGSQAAFVLRHWDERCERLEGWIEFEADDQGPALSVSADVLLE